MSSTNVMIALAVAGVGGYFLYSQMATSSASQGNTINPQGNGSANAPDPSNSGQNLPTYRASDGMRLFSKAECQQLGGNWYSNGECLKPASAGGGSYSWDYRRR